MSEKLRTARTTFMPWRDIEMTAAEYADLLRQGLIVVEPATEPEPEAAAEVAKAPSPRPRPSKR